MVGLDSGSVNGLFVDNERVARAPIAASLTLRLGVQGPFVWFQVEPSPPMPAAPASPAAEPEDLGRTQAVVAKYFGEPVEGESVGEHTMMLRRAFRQVQRKQRGRYGKIIAALGVVALGIAGFAAYQYQQDRQQKAVAQDLFYAMKSLDVDIAGLEKLVFERGNAQGRGAGHDSTASAARKWRGTTIGSSASLQVYDRKMTEPERLVLRVARIFGECELAMPPDIAAEVGSYIKKWQSTGRYARAIERAQEIGLYAEDRRGAARAGSAAAVLLPRDAGERFRSLHQRAADAQGHRQGDVAVHSGDGERSTG